MFLVFEESAIKKILQFKLNDAVFVEGKAANIMHVDLDGSQEKKYPALNIIPQKIRIVAHDKSKYIEIQQSTDDYHAQLKKTGEDPLYKEILSKYL